MQFNTITEDHISPELCRYTTLCLIKAPQRDQRSAYKCQYLLFKTFSKHIFFCLCLVTSWWCHWHVVSIFWKFYLY